MKEYVQTVGLVKASSKYGTSEHSPWDIGTSEVRKANSLDNKFN